MPTRSTFDRSRPSSASPVTGDSVLPFVSIEYRGGMLSAIWGHVESVVNQPKSPPSLVLTTRTPLGARRTECIVGVGARILKGFEQLNLGEIHPGDFVVATLAEHSGWLETESIEVIAFRNDSAMGAGEE